MVQSFVFLELLDPEINSLISEIKGTLSGVRPTRPVHLTVRGPYDGSVPAGTLEKCRHVMRHDVIRIFGVGRFSNPDEEVVYLGVDSPNLRQIWWKPDFPIGRHGFEPHISLYRGTDATFADAAREFLASEGITLLCAEYRLVPFRPRQGQLFPSETASTNYINRLTEAGRIDATLLPRLRELVVEYHHTKLPVESSNNWALRQSAKKHGI